jgi:hypothetical protein
MNFSKDKSVLSIALVLILATAAIIATLPLTSAHYPPTEQAT